MNINEFARYTTTYEEVMPRIAIECLAASHNVSTEGVMDHLSPFFQSLANKFKRLSLSQTTRNKGIIGDLRAQLHNQTHYSGDRIEIDSKHCHEMFNWFSSGDTIEFKDVLKACENTKAVCELFDSTIATISATHIKADKSLSRITKPFATSLTSFNKSPQNLLPHGYKINFFTSEALGIDELFSISVDKVHSRSNSINKTIIDKADFHKLDSYINYFEKTNTSLEKPINWFTGHIFKLVSDIDTELKEATGARKEELINIKREVYNVLLIVCLGCQIVPIFIYNMLETLIPYHKLYLKHGI